MQAFSCVFITTYLASQRCGWYDIPHQADYNIYLIMNENTPLDYASIQAILAAEDLKMHASELHGLLSGLVCAGFTRENTDYTVLVNDLLNNSEGVPSKVKSLIKIMFAQLWTDILDESYQFQLLLPDDDEAIVERGNAIGAWVQGFNLGFGLEQKNNAVLSEDVKEILIDFVEIANLSDEMEEDENTEQAYYEIAEYVRISALLCFSELGNLPEKTESPILH